MRCFLPTVVRTTTFESSSVYMYMHNNKTRRFFYTLSLVATIATNIQFIQSVHSLPSPSGNEQQSRIMTSRTSSTAASRYLDYDPYAPGMAEKYGLPGSTDPEGFNPYADTVGPGIYGGSIERDSSGKVVIGEQYQNHNEGIENQDYS